MRTQTLRWISTGLCALIMMSSLLSAEPRPKDYKDLAPEELGVKLAKPLKDARTGFVVAGRNATALVEKLPEINRISVADLEEKMRNLFRRYLQDDEPLLAVLAADNRYVVEEMGLTHQELAKHLHVLAAIQQRRKDAEFVYYGRKFKVKHEVTWTVPVGSPFKDGTRVEDTVLTIHNLANGKKLTFYQIVPYMIERYGFYAGKTHYRIDPRNVVQTLDFLKEKAK